MIAIGFQLPVAIKVKFINEAQVKIYFIDYLLNSIKDKRTRIIEECSCYRDNRE